MHLLIQHQEKESHVRTVTDLLASRRMFMHMYLHVHLHIHEYAPSAVHTHTQCQHVKFSRMIQTPLFWHASVLGPFVSF